MGRINEYLQQRVPALIEQYKKGPQVPYTVVEPSEKICLILLPGRARPEDKAALKLEAFRAELGENWTFALQLWTRVLACEVDPEAIEAIQRIALKRAEQPSASESAVFATAGSREVGALVSEAEPAKDVAEQRVEFEVVKVDAQGKVTQRERRSAVHRQEDLSQGVLLDLVRVPDGEFVKGSPKSEGRDSERPQHRVTVSPFWMGQYAVTQAQWRAVAVLPEVERDFKPDPSHFKGANRPVECIDWDDAVEFCKRLTQYSGREYRLPSEAEWECACRAGTKTPFHFGDTLTEAITNYAANYTYGNGPKGEYRRQTTDVGSFPANAFGLYDTHGNVWEWCQDYWHGSYEGVPHDGSAWVTGGDSSRRLLRGGSWCYLPGGCRSAFRSRYTRDLRNLNVGFRVMCASSWTLA